MLIPAPGKNAKVERYAKQPNLEGPTDPPRYAG
jgi:hypothetical protein